MSLFDRRRRREDDLDDELRSHLALAARDRMEAGETPAGAERAARRDLGSIAFIKDLTREVWGTASLERLVQDMRYAVRLLRRNPGFALVAVLSLALGIGANTAAFSLADAVLLRPMPVDRPSEIVALTSRVGSRSFEGLSYPEFRDVRDASRAFDGLIAFRTARFVVARSHDPVPQLRFGLLVSDGFFEVLGVRPSLGRGFTASESRVPGGEPAVILSYETWRADFGGRADVIGSSVRINSLPFTIVGVAPESFTGVNQFMRHQIYVPLAMADRFGATSTSPFEDRTARTLTVRARLADGVDVTRAQAEADLIGQRLAASFPATNRDRSFRVQSDLRARIEEAPPTIVVAGLLLILAALVLVIACANVANLLLARARARSREVAVRLAIGAGRVRLLRQLLTESLVLAFAGGAVGMLLASLVIRALAAFRLPTDTPLSLVVRIDGRVLAFTVLAAAGSAVVFGLAPAWRTSSPNVAHLLVAGDLASTSGRVRLWGRHALVVAQIALSLVLLVVTGAAFDGFRRMMFDDPGLKADDVLMMEFDPAMIGRTPTAVAEFYGVLLDRVRQLPTVRSAALASIVPFRPNFRVTPVVPEGFQFARDDRSAPIATAIVSDRYFDTMRTPITAGRAFTLEDSEDSRAVAIVNGAFAERYWPGLDPIGRRVRLGENGPFAEVVGVAKTGKYLSPAEVPQPYLYLPASQHPESRMTLLVATRGEPVSLSAPLLGLVRSIDREQPVFNLRDFRSFFANGVLAIPRVLLQLVVASGAVGLVLAVIGLYGLVSYSAARRTREIGIRLAIGAGRKDILRLVLSHGLWLSGVGVAIGVLVSLPLFGLLSAGLVGLGSLSPLTLIVVPLGLMAVTVIACLVPAIRAARLDPTTALRN